MDVNDLVARPSVEDLRRWFRYEPETGLLMRLVARGNCRAGSVAGVKNTYGHLAVELCGRNYGVHRIAWALYHGEWPSMDVDHKNGCPHDNRIANLRLVTVSQNIRNSKTYRKASGLPRGVTKRIDGFAARITRRPGAGADFIGTFKTIDEAANAYLREARKAFGEHFREGA